MLDCRRVIVTGGPGAGKTTLLAEVAARGFPVLQDSAREIICARKAKGLSARPEPAEFANQILKRDVEQYHSAGPGILFYERAIPDALGMLNHLGCISFQESRDVLKSYRYLNSIFVLPPWEAIYVTDSERDQSFAESVLVHEFICRWYGRLGYELVEVRPGPVQDRCGQILDRLESE